MKTLLYSYSMTTAKQRETALDLFRAGLAAADPYRLLKEYTRLEGRKMSCESLGSRVEWELPALDSDGRLIVVGAGKGAASLAKAVEESLGDRIKSGRIVVKHDHGLPLERIVVEEGGHPLPDPAGLAGTSRLLEELEGTRPDDRVIFLLTGGGSALLVAPAEGLNLEHKIETTRHLLHCGATIQEMNTLRKHLSAVKGGRLLERIAPARSMTFIISDVVGDDLASIGSGPTAPDPSTFSDCLEILARYRLTEEVPGPVLQRLRDGAEGRISETPKPGDPIFSEAQHLILASNRQTVEAARSRAQELGYEVEVFAYDMEGSTHEKARAFTARLAELAGRRVVLLAGGETTLVVKGSGKGGRNQEFALVAAREMEGHEGLFLLSAGTDGTDGPTDAAGAFADETTFDRARSRGLDPLAYLANNDAYHLFEPLGDLLKTGPTGTNVMDLVVGLAQ